MKQDACNTLKTRAAFHYLQSQGQLSVYEDYLKTKKEGTDGSALWSKVPLGVTDAAICAAIGEDTINGIFEKVDLLKGDKTVDIIIGGPPCQAYSVAGRARMGKAVEEDPRNELYKYYVQFLARYQPKMFVFENVLGIITAKRGEPFFSESLNDLAGVAVIAAQKQLKSERMKTELITNVSHDIKTPLTSIINYVDLLQKPHTDEEQEQYLEVLDRQSQQLKKLIEDLMDMSKASTGNMTVEITQVDAVESVNQALGEFADKLDKVQLYPVFRHTEESVAMMADGRLTWRVLNNLLSNAVKYALPGTRLYIDLMELEGKVVISLKNISREELNIDADELMERFVRGDDSRNTEGSGLGLNIAKSLMELQKGQLQLLVDGDLFKVTLIFPGA